MCTFPSSNVHPPIHIQNRMAHTYSPSGMDDQTKMIWYVHVMMLIIIIIIINVSAPSIARTSQPHSDDVVRGWMEVYIQILTPKHVYIAIAYSKTIYIYIHEKTYIACTYLDKHTQLRKAIIKLFGDVATCICVMCVAACTAHHIYSTRTMGIRHPSTT